MSSRYLFLALSSVRHSANILTGGSPFLSIFVCRPAYVVPRVFHFGEFFIQMYGSFRWPSRTKLRSFGARVSAVGLSAATYHHSLSSTGVHQRILPLQIRHSSTMSPRRRLSSRQDDDEYLPSPNDEEPDEHQHRSSRRTRTSKSQPTGAQRSRDTVAIVGRSVRMPSYHLHVMSPVSSAVQMRVMPVSKAVQMRLQERCPALHAVRKKGRTL